MSWQIAVQQIDLYLEVAADAEDLGWRLSDDGVSKPPSMRDVRWALGPSWRLVELFGFGTTTGEWKSRVIALTPAGETTMLAMLRRSATGPKERPS